MCKKKVTSVAIIVFLILLVPFIALGVASGENKESFEGYEEIEIWQGDHEPDDALIAELEEHAFELRLNSMKEELIEQGISEEALRAWEEEQRMAREEEQRMAREEAQKMAEE